MTKLQLEVDRDCGAVIIRFQGSPDIMDIQRTLMNAIDVITTEKLNKAVIDTSGLEVMFTLSLYWYRKEWYPLANRSGLNTIAVILPENFAHQRFLDRLNQTEKSDVAIYFHYYTDNKEALKWIKSVV